AEPACGCPFHRPDRPALEQPGLCQLALRAEARGLARPARLSLTAEVEHLRRQIRPADEKVRNRRVGLVVDERAAVEPARMEARTERYRGRRAIVPFVLPARMIIEIRVPR